MHASTARYAERTPHVSASQLGTAGAVRQLLPGTSEDDRGLLASDLRSLSLLGRRRRDLPHPLQLIRIHPWAGIRPVESAADVADRSHPGEISSQPERPEFQAESVQLH